MYVCMYEYYIYIYIYIQIYVYIYIHHIYHICCVCKSIISNAAYIQTYTYSWTLDPGLFSACTFKSDALRKKLRFKIMTLSHFETQPERAKKERQHSKDNANLVSCQDRSDLFSVLFGFRLEIWILDPNLRARRLWVYTCVCVI